MRAALLTLSALICAAPLIAHEGPEGEIEELTERMKRNGETADLLTERAIEYRVIGKLGSVPVPRRGLRSIDSPTSGTRSWTHPPCDAVSARYAAANFAFAAPRMDLAPTPAFTVCSVPRVALVIFLAAAFFVSPFGAAALAVTVVPACSAAFMPSSR